MKKSILMAVLVTLPLSMPLAWAEADHHSDKNKPAATMTKKDKQKQIGKMQESMLQMHDQMHKIMDAKNPQERARLTQEHSTMMHDHMQMMHDMDDHRAMGGDTKGGKMEGGM